ncbi:hypothetical protein KEG38_42790 [Polyangium jinanense]|nr:hypothetical protein [Polyangium jinanense]
MLLREFDNGSAVWIMHSNGTQDCRAAADRDDMRFRADSAAGATHNDSLIFIKWVDDDVACEPR